MRRFSQRNYLVTLSDINITPLLDLAFVLLIIFVITTPLLTQSLDLNLPTGGRLEKRPRNQKDIRTVEISRDGLYRLDRKTMTPDQIEIALINARNANPNMVVDLRADKDAPWGLIATILDRCQRHNITRISPRTAMPKRP